ncbi:MAG: HEAT repeat domain-containing protein [Bacteroidota bacterium]
MRIEFLIAAALAVGATFFVVIVAIGLFINKLVEVRQTRNREKLYQLYSGMFADLLMQPVEAMSGNQSRGSVLDQYEDLIAPVKNGLEWSTPARKKLHRGVIRRILIDFANDLAGDSMDRLLYFFYSLEFVKDELELLQSNKWWVRARAARDLGLLRAKKATTALTIALEDEHPDVRNEAMQSLIKLVGVVALGTILKSAKNISQWTSLELSLIVKESEEEAFPYLVQALGYSDQSVVLFTIEMLAETGFVTAVAPLMQVVKTYPNVLVRAKAAEALGRLGDQRAETLLHELLKNPYPQLRASATRALERIGSPDSTPLLLERMQSGPVAERLSAARAMARSGESGLQKLREAAEGTDTLQNGIALHVLEEVEGVEVP